MDARLVEAGEGVLETTVLVVGAGPAGGDLSRRLAAAGVEVLLVDQLEDLSRAAFSSAALPLAALEQHGLPALLVAHRWSRWQLHGPGDGCRQWQGRAPLGVVLDFAALRGWLAEEARRWGARLQLGWRALECSRLGDGTLLTTLRDRAGRRHHCRSRWVVDASGQGRALLGEPPSPHDLISGVGVEWLLQVGPQSWQRWSDRLSFCLGSGWVPQGYGWIFPMSSSACAGSSIRLRPSLPWRGSCSTCCSALAWRMPRCSIAMAAGSAARSGGVNPTGAAG